MEVGGAEGPRGGEDCRVSSGPRDLRRAGAGAHACLPRCLCLARRPRRADPLGGGAAALCPSPEAAAAAAASRPPRSRGSPARGR